MHGCKKCGQINLSTWDPCPKCGAVAPTYQHKEGRPISTGVRSAITVLDQALYVAENNEPINRAEGNAAQADLEAASAAEYRAALALLGGDGVGLIAAERRRQIEAEGWTPEHDDEHDLGELARAGASYAVFSQSPETAAMMFPAVWGKSAWKPSDDPVRNLVRAGALIAAEIDRLERIKKEDLRK